MPACIRALVTSSRMLSSINWNIVSYPSPAWAKQVFPDDEEHIAVAKLADAIITCTNEADVTSKLLAIGVVPKSMTTPEFGAFIADETEKWAKVVRFADMKVD